jgi:transposase InsO family protein
MTAPRLYDLKTIAQAMNKTIRSITKRANKGLKRSREQPWAPAKTVTRRGQETRLFELGQLPADVQQALVDWERQRSCDRINRQAREDQARHEREMAEAAAAYGERKKTEAQEKAAARLKVIQEGLAKYSKLPRNSYKRLRAEGRRWLVIHALDIAKETGCSLKNAWIELARRTNAHEIELPDFVADAIPQRKGKRVLSHGTLKNWHYNYNDRGIWGLVPNYGNRQGQSKIAQNPALEKVVLGIMAEFPHITPRDVKAYLEAEHPQLNIVSEKSIERYQKRWKEENRQVWAQMSNPDQWKNIYMPAFGDQHEQIDRLNQLWEMDSTPGDWMLTDGRHSVVGVVDLWSRRLKLYVSKSSTALAVCQVFRRAVIDWGMPECVRTDNGKDYVSRHFKGVLQDLQIPQQLCIPFKSEQKATIERALQTMSHGILDLLPGFIGHSVTERKVIEARKSFAKRIMTKGEVVDVSLSSAELQEKLDEWVEHVYNHNEHSGLGGKTPFQRAAEYRAPIRRISNERALDMLLASSPEPKTVGKKGIRLDNRFYIAPELGGMLGDEVHIKRDEADIGRIYVYHETKGFVCIAECPEALGISPAEIAAAAHHVARHVNDEAKAKIKEARKSIKKNPAVAILEHRKRQSHNIAALPQPAEEYSTPALEAAAQAADAADNINRPTETPVDEGEHQALVQAFRKAEVVEIDDDPRRIHARWLRIKDQRDRGEWISEEDRRGLEVYLNSAEFTSQQELFEAFGLTAEDFK